MSRSKSWKYGIPFIIFVIGGSIGLREFTMLRFKYKPTSDYQVRDELEKTGFMLKPVEETTLEKEHEKLEQMDLDNWDNVRIKRPWDENAENQV